MINVFYFSKKNLKNKFSFAENLFSAAKLKINFLNFTLADRRFVSFYLQSNFWIANKKPVKKQSSALQNFVLLRLDKLFFTGKIFCSKNVAYFSEKNLRFCFLKKTKRKLCLIFVWKIIFFLLLNFFLQKKKIIFILKIKIIIIKIK